MMNTVMQRADFAPRVCVWEITRSCQLRCSHCGSLAGPKRPDELTTSECLHLLDDLAALGCEVVTLSGGEPTLRADWPDLAAHARDLGLVVNMVSNGQGDAARLAADAGRVGLANVGISIDGLEPTHDALRGKGSHAHAVATVRTLAACGVFTEVMFTANRRNLRELEAVHALAVDAGARALRTQLAKPMGRMTGRDDFALCADDMLDLLPRLARLAAQGPIVMHVGDSVGYYSPAERALRVSDRGLYQPWTGCHAGVHAIGIQSDGSVKGCLSLQPHEGERDPFVEGNVRDTPLREIWSRPGAFAYNRDPGHHALGGACAACDHARVCRGGASCVSFAFTGALGSDPVCYFAARRAQASVVEQDRLRRSARRLAAALVAFGLPACGGVVTPVDGAGGDVAVDAQGATDSAPGDVRDVTAVTDAGDEPVDCAGVCCACDYGLPPPPVCCP